MTGWEKPPRKTSPPCSRPASCGKLPQLLRGCEFYWLTAPAATPKPGILQGFLLSLYTGPPCPPGSPYVSPTELTALLHQEIPLVQALGLAVEKAEANRLRLRGPFEANRNLHGTVFAGSIYCFATLAGWSLVHDYCQRQQLPAAIMLRHADIRYLRPLTGSPVAEAWLPEPEEVEQFLHGLRSKGRARLLVPAELKEGEQVAARFLGEYVAVRESA